MRGLSGRGSIVVLASALALGIAPLFLRWSLQEVLLSLMIVSAVTAGIVENLPGELRGRRVGGLPRWLSVRALAYCALAAVSFLVILSAALSRG
jgi:hypothetical protein